MKKIRVEIVFLVVVLLVGIAANTGTAYGYGNKNLSYPYPYPYPYPQPYPYPWSGSRIYVKWDATGANNGSSWADAYTDLQTALSAALYEDDIWVAAGIYKPTSGMDRTVSFVLRYNVDIYGGFSGAETQLSQRDYESNLTILSGDLKGDDNDNIVSDDVTRSDNSYHVVIGGVGSASVLDGFIIQGGNANGAYSNNAGGGMYNRYYSSMDIKNVTFIHNTAGGFGGAMYNQENSYPELTSVTFASNVAQHGGGMYNYVSNPILKNVTFSGNIANGYNNNEKGVGGGMYNDSSAPVLTNVTFGNNKAGTAYDGGGLGGGMYNDSSAPVLTNVIIANSTGGGDCAGTSLNNTSANNLIEDTTNTCGLTNGVNNNIIGVDPSLGPLTDNGGFTRTMALLSGSPAIDAGDDGVCPATDQRGVTRPFGSQCDIGAYEYDGPAYTILQMNFSSVGTYDGWILESNETSSNGGTLNSNSNIFYLGDDAQNRQYRTILHFDTSSLPDNAVIVDAKLRLSTNEVVSGTNPFLTHDKIVIELNTGAYSTSSNLQLDDFKLPSDRNGAGAVRDNLVNGFYRGRLKGDVLEYFNLNGATQVRLRFKTDDDDDNVADLIEFFTGNASVSADRPRLVIYYYIP